MKSKHIMFPPEMLKEMEEQMKKDGIEGIGPYVRFIVKQYLNEKKK